MIQCTIWQDCLSHMLAEKLVAAFIMTKSIQWLPVIKSIFTSEGYAITINENSITVYGKQEAIELPLIESGVGEALQSYLVNGSNEPLQSSEPPMLLTWDDEDFSD
jgi:hypothetical protein